MPGADVQALLVQKPRQIPHRRGEVVRGEPDVGPSGVVWSTRACTVPATSSSSTCTAIRGVERGDGVERVAARPDDANHSPG